MPRRGGLAPALCVLNDLARLLLVLAVEAPQHRDQPGSSQKDSQEIIGDEISRFVSCKGRSDVGPLVGEQIRLRFIMKDANFFPIRFR